MVPDLPDLSALTASEAADLEAIAAAALPTFSAQADAAKSALRKAHPDTSYADEQQAELEHNQRLLKMARVFQNMAHVRQRQAAREEIAEQREAEPAVAQHVRLRRERGAASVSVAA